MGGFGLKYLLQLPEGYQHQSAEKWPLILFLHGSGERGDSLGLVKAWGPPCIAAEKGLPFIVISPQCPLNEKWITMLLPLRILLDSVINQLQVDTSRIYLTGLSMGGYGAFTMAQMYPDYFAAVAPVCGGGIPSLTKYSKTIPTWIFHGEADSIVPLSASQLMADALKNQSAEIKFTVYPGVGHDSWIRAYNDIALYSWFLQHRKTN